ncbi:MAG: hypothetical protein ABI334_04080 [Candidatus Dormiibacterota bacterium]
MEKQTAVADFNAARNQWDSAFAKVPDGALKYLKPDDDYALGGLQVHVNWVLTHYSRILDGMIAGGFRQLAPLDAPGEAEAAGHAAKAGLAANQRAKALDEMWRLHEAVLAAVTKVREGDWSRKAAVVYGEGQDPFPTSAEDIVGWLCDHYREHVQQSADLVGEWRAKA